MLNSFAIAALAFNRAACFLVTRLVSTADCIVGGTCMQSFPDWGESGKKLGVKYAVELSVLFTCSI